MFLHFKDELADKHERDSQSLCSAIWNESPLYLYDQINILINLVI